MKIAILCDTHFGARNDGQIFLDYYFKFFDDVFFPACEERGVKTVLHLGDLMDRRKFVNFNTLAQVRERFMDRLQGMEVHCIVGNHDTYFKNTNEVNSPKELFGSRYPDFHIYDTPVELTFDNTKIAMVPWINKGNEQESIDFINQTDATILAGHFELEGYQVMRGVKHTDGMKPDMLQRFDKVWSGHFHIKHEENNICYFGTAYQMTFADLFEKKGFHIYDTETDEIEFVPNPDNLFHAIKYNDDIDLAMIDFRQYAGRYVKVFVHEKKDAKKFDRLIERLYDSKAESVTILENETPTSQNVEVEQEDLATDTMTLINSYVDDVFSDDPEECKRLKEVFKELFLESFDI